MVGWVNVRCDISQKAPFLQLYFRAKREKFGAFWMASSKNMLKIPPPWPESTDHPQFHPQFHPQYQYQYQNPSIPKFLA
jgi:hypothetical protein